MLLFSEVHSKLCRSSCEDCPTQKRRRNKLNNMWDHLFLFSCMAYLCNKFDVIHSFTLLTENKT